MLSKKNQYALKAISHLTKKYKKGPVPILEIAEIKKIPIKFLENILLELKNKDVLESKKGKGGGYFLKRDPKTMSVASIIRAIDGPIALLPCVSINFYAPCENCNEKTCKINKIFIQARNATLQILENKTLLDLI